jgi:hypothetical protein
MEGWVVAHNIENGVTKNYPVIVKSKKNIYFYYCQPSSVEGKVVCHNFETTNCYAAAA